MSETFESIDYHNASKESKDLQRGSPATDSDVNVPLASDNNLHILYITLAIIVGLLLIWIIVVTVTKEDPLKILNEMNNLTSQMQPVSDNINIDPIYDPNKLESAYLE